MVVVGAEGRGRKSGARAPPPLAWPSVHRLSGGGQMGEWVTRWRARRREDGFGVGVGGGGGSRRRKGDLKARTLIGGDEAPGVLAATFTR